MSSLGFLSSVVNRLKMEFGEPITIIVLGEETLDVESGVKVRTTIKYPVRRAVEIPQNSGRKFAYDIAYLAANKNFTYGGSYDVDIKVLLVDAKDMPKTYVPCFDTIIRYQDKDYKVMKIGTLAKKQGWEFTIKHVENTPNEL